MARCKNAVAPLVNKAPTVTTVQGRLTVVVQNMPFMAFDAATGFVQDPSRVYLVMGDRFGVFKRVAFLYGNMLALEFSLPIVTSASSVSASLTVNPPSGGRSLMAAFAFDRFNAEMKLICLSNCDGSGI